MKLLYMQATLEVPSDWTEAKERAYVEQQLLSTPSEKASLKLSETEPQRIWQQLEIENAHLTRELEAARIDLAQRSWPKCEAWKEFAEFWLKEHKCSRLGGDKLVFCGDLIHWDYEHPVTAVSRSRRAA